MSNTKAILLEDVISFGRNKECYGRKDAKLIITNKPSDTVWIVKNLDNGKVFSAKPNQVKEIS